MAIESATGNVALLVYIVPFVTTKSTVSSPWKKSSSKWKARKIHHTFNIAIVSRITSSNEMNREMGFNMCIVPRIWKKKDCDDWENEIDCTYGLVTRNRRGGICCVKGRRRRRAEPPPWRRVTAGTCSLELIRIFLRQVKEFRFFDFLRTDVPNNQQLHDCYEWME